MRTRRVIGVVVTVGAALAFGGCASQTVSERLASEYQMNPSPELDTLHERPIDITNRMAITTDENLRMLNADLGRVFLFERQSRLSPFPITR